MAINIEALLMIFPSLSVPIRSDSPVGSRYLPRPSDDVLGTLWTLASVRARPAPDNGRKGGDMVETQTPVTEARDHIPDWARQRAEMLQGLYIHVLVYLVINAGLALMNWALKGDDGGWWVVWPILGWGIGLAIHALAVALPVFGPDWVEQRAENIVRRRG